MKANRPVGQVLLLAVASLLGASVAVRAENVPATIDLDTCGQILATMPYNDYRTRGSSPRLRSEIEDNWRAHMQPATERLRSGEYSQRVLADIVFTLRGWPNHVVALRALSDYFAGGGRQYEFFEAECYFRRARAIVPDDPDVLLVHALHYRKLRNNKRAIELFEDALNIASTSIDIHYNLGLLYFETGEMEKSLEHAQAAYTAGYPLSGLRDKLKQAQIWREPTNHTGVNP